MTDKQQSKLANERSRKELVDKFNPVVNILIEILKKKSGRNRAALDNIDRLKKRISLLKNLDSPEALIRDSANFFFDYTDKILDKSEKREEYFEGLNVRAEFLATGRKITSEDEFIFELVDLIKTINRTTGPEEKKVVWGHIITLHEKACEYLLLTGS